MFPRGHLKFNRPFVAVWQSSGNSLHAPCARKIEACCETKSSLEGSKSALYFPSFAKVFSELRAAEAILARFTTAHLPIAFITAGEKGATCCP